MPDHASPPQAADVSESANARPVPAPLPVPWRLTLLAVGMVIELGAAAPDNPHLVEGVNRRLQGTVRFIAEISNEKDEPVEYEVHIEPKEGTGFPDTDRPLMANGKPVTRGGKPVYHSKWYRMRVPAGPMVLVEEAGPEAFFQERRDELESDEPEEEEDEEDEEEEEGEDGETGAQ